MRKPAWSALVRAPETPECHTPRTRRAYFPEPESQAASATTTPRTATIRTEVRR
ncbi:hypothetical protein GCM10019017_43110 [Streptomyces showdoensis]